MDDGETPAALLQSMDEIFHARARLGIMTLLLADGGSSDFTPLKARLQLTDGNLGAHLRVLEEAGYIEVLKSFQGRRPRTTCRITERGRTAFQQYLKKLEALILMATQTQGENGHSDPG